MVDLADVKGQEHAKRALEVAVAGGHHILLVGPTGVGKTMLAHAAASILPPLTPKELGTYQMELWGGDHHRPFHSLSHGVTVAALLAGADGALPEAAQAHRGVLLLDDLPLFRPSVLAALREVLDNRRAGSYPASFILIATMNACPCGLLEDPRASCRCSPREIARWWKRVPTPLLDRIEIHVQMPPVSPDRLLATREGEPAEAVRQRIERARRIQATRFEGTPVCYNAEMPVEMVERFCSLDDAGQGLMKALARQMAVTARVYHNILRVARTIADLAGAEKIETPHLAEAIQYRPRQSVWR